MRQETRKYGTMYYFDNGCKLSVISGWAAMADDERPYEVMLFTPWGQTDAVGYQTQADIYYLLNILEHNLEDKIKEVLSKYPDEIYCPEKPELPTMEVWYSSNALEAAHQIRQVVLQQLSYIEKYYGINEYSELKEKMTPEEYEAYCCLHKVENILCL